jgi:hypothetical protein
MLLMAGFFLGFKFIVSKYFGKFSPFFFAMSNDVEM